MNKQKSYRIWILLFLLFNIFYEHGGGTNADSRYCALEALVEDGTFRIDHYQKDTIDWSQTPDGHYYSNKAPGPVLLAWPFFWIFDSFANRNLSDRAARDGHRNETIGVALKTLSFLVQQIPFAIAAELALSFLLLRGVSAGALHLSAAALLFGNTAALLMNTFFGHGVAAWWVLLLSVALLKNAPAGVGFFLGGAILSDYGCALLAIPLLGVLLFRDARYWLKFLSGGLLPGAIWIFYHYHYFGGILSLPNKFQNPIFVDLPHQTANLWGIISPLPNLKVLAQLIFGFSRGLLWTQPWVPIFVVLLLAKKSTYARTSLAAFLLPSFILLLWMNSGFGGWHGGMSPGPRYLSAVLPSLALLLGFVFDAYSSGLKTTLRISVAISVVFAGLVLSTLVIAPVAPLWPYYIDVIWHSPTPTALIRFGVFMLVATVTAISIRWKFSDN
jgi:hypothetical protein